MRLTPNELNAIRQTLLQADQSGHIWLFGSRADDSRRGGDIDLYLETSQPLSLKESLALEYRLTTLCGTKVDLLVKNPGQAKQLIHEIARKECRFEQRTGHPDLCYENRKVPYSTAF